MAAIQIANFKALIQPLANIGTIGKGWSSNLFQALTNCQNILDRLATSINALDARISNLETVFGTDAQRIYIRSYFITGAFAVPFPDTPIGSIIFILLTSDAVGLHVVTYPTEFVGGYTSTVTADDVSLLIVRKQSATQVIVLYQMDNISTA